MMNCWPSSFPMRSPTMRATTSVGPPAANGTMMVIGLLGNVWASAGAATLAIAAGHGGSRRRIGFVGEAHGEAIEIDHDVVAVDMERWNLALDVAGADLDQPFRPAHGEPDRRRLRIGIAPTAQCCRVT